MLILASLSPRRRELMRTVTEEFEAVAPDVDEAVPAGTPPEDMVVELALRKARAVAADRPGDIVVGADTVVVLDGAALGKPRDTADARRMLAALSGREHHVYTGAALVHNRRAETFTVRTAVQFRTLSQKEIDAYIATGEPMDKAGAYGIQGKGALFVTGIRGDYFNVVGFPICMLAQKLRDFGANLD